MRKSLEEKELATISNNVSKLAQIIDDALAGKAVYHNEIDRSSATRLSIRDTSAPVSMYPLNVLPQTWIGIVPDNRGFLVALCLLTLSR